MGFSFSIIMKQPTKSTYKDIVGNNNVTQISLTCRTKHEHENNPINSLILKRIRVTDLSNKNYFSGTNETLRRGELLFMALEQPPGKYHIRKVKQEDLMKIDI